MAASTQDLERKIIGEYFNGQIDSFIDKIKNAKTAVVTAHVNPDGDTLGSMLAIAKVLEQAGVERVDRLMHDQVPDVYKFFPGQEMVLCSQDEADRQKLLPEYDLSFSCDCGSVERLGTAAEFWRKAKTTGNIDHHLSNPLFADINIVDSNATSTGQVINYIAEKIGVQVDKDLASLMYITLLTDTGGFRHSNTNQNAFAWGAQLISQGADASDLYNRLFNQMPYRAIKIVGDALHKIELGNLKTSQGRELNFAYTYTLRKDLDAVGAKDEDTDEIVDHVMRIKDLDFCIYLREGKRPGTIKGSLRSTKDFFDCSEIASKTNGGGHARAAGFNIDGSIDDIKANTLNLIKQSL